MRSRIDYGDITKMASDLKVGRNRLNHYLNCRVMKPNKEKLERIQEWINKNRPSEQTLFAEIGRDGQLPVSTMQQPSETEIVNNQLNSK
jgi:hypothetical protein